MPEHRGRLDEAAEQPWWRAAPERAAASRWRDGAVDPELAVRLQRRYALAPSLGAGLDALLDHVRSVFPFERLIALAAHRRHGLARGAGVRRDELRTAENVYLAGSGDGDPHRSGPLLAALESWREGVVISAHGFGPASRLAVALDVDRRHPALAEVRRALDLAAPFLVRAAELHQMRESIGVWEARSWRLQRALDAVPEPVLVLDHERSVRAANRRAAELFLADAAGLDAEGDRDVDVAEARSRAVATNNLFLSAHLSRSFLRPPRDDDASDEMRLLDPASGAPLRFEVLQPASGHARGAWHDAFDPERPSHERGEESILVLREAVAEARPADDLEKRVARATSHLEERNRALMRTAEEFRRSSHAKTRFLARMSHELRTPINAILGYNQLLRDGHLGPIDERQEEGLRRMRGAAEHLLSVVNDILDLSKVEAGRMPIAVTEVAVEDFLLRSCDSVRPMLEAKGLACTVHVSAGTPTLRTDRTRLGQVVLNLLSNAVKFTDRGGVTVRAGPTADRTGVWIEVEDTGIGIAGEDLETIFDDFRQAGRPTSRQHGGTGLGLSISRKMARLLGGTLGVRSRPGTGTVFRLELPVELPASASE